MKRIEAIIRSSKFDEVKEGLSHININFFTFLEVQGYGKEKGSEVHYRGAVYDLGSIPRMEIHLVVSDEKVEEVVQCLLRSAHTGEVGDGKIFISSIDRVISIRDGREGLSAL